ncbi:MAG TPA: hypothetical protein DCE42_27085, partial [Myxococcales bacterium]|nr:hypothetical protein [Myxococcales bacterium]
TSPPAGGNKQQGEACDAVSNLCANGLACVSSGAEQRCRVLCSTESDCVTGEACKSVSAGQNVCICETDADCRGGKKCSNFQCIDGTPAGGGDGEPCRSDGSCQNGLTCITHPTTNIDTCVKDCQGAAVCPTGQVCDSQLKACVPDTTKPGGADQGQPCNTSTPCKAGLICIGQGNAALCYKECDGTVGSCPTGTKCTPVSGSNDSFCKAVAPTGCNPACPTGQTCQNGTCVNDTPAGCNPACPTGQTCQNGTCVNINTSGCDPACSVGQICENGTCVFAPQCDANTACAYGQECINGICELKDETPIKPPKAVGCTTLHTAPTSLPLIVFGLFLLVLVRRRRWLG